ncbi:MAG: maleylpyruvate isomerase N-terminal domain-containing protein [Actinomycetota bacterium]|nr:maleylpyruvate isomerase N-terminal domain-containing protein [Actinomycetota bacterium]
MERRPPSRRTKASSSRASSAGASPVGALRDECERVSEVVRSLDEDAFALPTRCPPWRVKELVGHIWRDVDRLRTCFDGPPDEPVEEDAVSYWRSYDPVADGPMIADHAKEVADGFTSGRELARSFADLWPALIDRAEGEDPSRSVRTFGPVLRLDEFLKTRVLETAVHRLDLLDALGRERSVPPGSAAVVVPVLEALLGSPLPAALGWTDLEFVETGTGRRAIGTADAASLADLVERFPLLG